MEKQICSFCSIEIYESDQKHFCSQCGKAYHKSCFNAAGECSCGGKKFFANENTSAENSVGICSFCLFQIDESENLYVCPVCSKKYHKECFDVAEECTCKNIERQAEVEQPKVNIKQPLTSTVTNNGYEGTFCIGCGKEIAANDSIIVCNSCKAPQHKSCWIKNKGCASPKCNAQAASSKAETPSADSGNKVINAFADSSKGKICPNCKRINLHDANFCTFCRTNLQVRTTGVNLPR